MKLATRTSETQEMRAPHLQAGTPNLSLCEDREQSNARILYRRTKAVCLSQFRLVLEVQFETGTKTQKTDLHVLPLEIKQTLHSVVWRVNK